MNKIVLIFCLGFVFFLFGCNEVSDEWKQAAVVAASIHGAVAPNIVFDAKVGEDGQRSNMVRINLGRIESVDDEYPADAITSTAAMALIQNVKLETRQKFNEVQVLFDRGQGLEEKTYSIKFIEEAITLMPVITDFLEAPAAQGAEERRRCVDLTTVTDSVLSLFTNALIEVENKQGPTLMHQIGGFRFDKIKASGEQLLVVWATSIKKNTQIPYTFYVSKKTGKIISISTVAFK